MRVFSKLAESFVAMVGRRAAGAGAYCQSLEMTVVQTQANDFVLRVRYTLQATASDGTDHLVLSSILSPLQVENITASGGFAASDHLAAPGPHLFLSTASGQKEREIVVNAVYRWVPGQCRVANRARSVSWCQTPYFGQWRTLIKPSSGRNAGIVLVRLSLRLPIRLSGNTSCHSRRNGCIPSARCVSNGFSVYRCAERRRRGPRINCA